MEYNPNQEWVSNNRRTAETIAHLVSIASGTPHVVTEVGPLADEFAVTPATGNEQPRLTYGEVANARNFFGAAYNVCENAGHDCNDKIGVPLLETLGGAGHVAFELDRD